MKNSRWSHKLELLLLRSAGIEFQKPLKAPFGYGLLIRLTHFCRRIATAAGAALAWEVLGSKLEM